MRWLVSEFMNDIPETCKAIGVPEWNDPRPVSVRLFECSAKLERQNNRYAEVLHDGYAVYAALTDDAKRYTTPENVSAVLDAFKSALANTAVSDAERRSL
jgi:hypothetical protein